MIESWIDRPLDRFNPVDLSGTVTLNNGAQGTAIVLPPSRGFKYLRLYNLMFGYNDAITTTLGKNIFISTIEGLSQLSGMPIPLLRVSITQIPLYFRLPGDVGGTIDILNTTGHNNLRYSVRLLGLYEAA